jgi:molybdopterin/thiamine biosynthesis adenylyltransferase
MSADPRIRVLEAGARDLDVLEDRLSKTVEISIDADEAGWARQLTMICMVDLLARLLPNLAIDCPVDLAADPALPPGPATLVGRLDEARGYSLLDPGEGNGELVVRVRIGAGDAADLYVEGFGWVSYLGTTRPERIHADPVNPIGPLVAACRGAAWVIRHLLDGLLPGSPPVIESAYWSALSMSPTDAEGLRAEPPLRDPTVHALLMGAGSIGGSCVYALARVPGLEGLLGLIDFDRLEDDNSRKALLARREAIGTREEKVRVAALELAHLDLDAPCHPESLAQYVAAQAASEPLPLVLCAVDSIPARRELADHMPRDAVNAACGDNHISVSGHRVEEGPCVYCLYMEQVLDRDRTRAKMIGREVGLPDPMVLELRRLEAPLQREHLVAIERFRKFPPHALAPYRGRTLDELFDEQILYGEQVIADPEGRRSALQLPFVPALAGILLASEALKRGSGLGDHALGPGGIGIEYSESLFQPPIGLISSPPRWPTSECLCRSLRRIELMRARYGID